MRRLLLPLLAAACFIPTLIQANTNEHPINKIAAIVNGHVILESTVNTHVASTKKQAQAAQMAPMSDASLHELVTNQLVMEQLQLQIAQRHHIGSTSEQLTQAIQTVAKENHLTVTQLKAKITREGGSFSEFKKRLSKQLIIMALQRQVVSGTDTRVTTADVAAYRNTHHLQHTHYLYQVGDIHITVPEHPTAEQTKNINRRASDIAKQIKNGTNFQQLAKLESSSDTPNADNVLSWRSKDELPTAFEKAFTTYKVGESAGPIHTDNGWHIIKILNRKANQDSMSNKQIREFLFRQKYNAAIDKWLKSLRKSSDVHVLNQ